jgi:cell division protein FtsB
MSEREMLIARKQQVRRELERAQRELETLRERPNPPDREIAQLENQVEQLMAEEFNLRVAIDQSR